MFAVVGVGELGLQLVPATEQMEMLVVDQMWSGSLPNQ